MSITFKQYNQMLHLRLLPALWTAISMLTSTLYQDWVTMETGSFVR